MSKKTIVFWVSLVAFATLLTISYFAQSLVGFVMLGIMTVLVAVIVSTIPLKPLDRRIILGMSDGTIYGIKLRNQYAVEIRDYDVPDDFNGDIKKDEHGQYQEVILRKE